MVAEGLFGHMAAFRPPEIVPAPLTEVIGELAKQLHGICQ
jgi:hypothetical protein